MNTAQSAGAAKGYISEEHKQKYTIIVGVLCAVFFLGQFIVPFLVMVPMMNVYFMSAFKNTSMIKVNDGVVWNDHIWVPEEKLMSTAANAGRMWIYRYPIHGGEGLEQVVELPKANLWLIPDRDRLWLISSSQTAYYKDSAVTTVLDGIALGDISRPFLYKNQPAVVEEHPNGFRLMVLEKHGWQNHGILKFHFRDEQFNTSRHLRVLTLDGQTHWFARFGDTLYYRDTIPFEADADSGGWTLVAPVKGSWDAAVVRGRPAYFETNSEEAFSGKLSGYALENGAWKQFADLDIGFGIMWGVFPEKQGDRFAMLLQSFPGSLRYIYVDSNAITQKIKIGQGSLFPKKFFYMVLSFQFLPYLAVLLLAVILTVLMTNNRTLVYEADTARAHYASLAKRALAELIDMVLVLLPAGIWAVNTISNMMSDFDDFFTQMPFSVFKMFGLWGLFMLWGLVCLFVFSFLEGKYGVTPGKWVFKIRVTGTDLHPCGFGRAILRNLLKIVDGFFGFLVGITLVALTENWQRLGDLAARTIVIDISHGIEPVENFSFS